MSTARSWHPGLRGRRSSRGLLRRLIAVCFALATQHSDPPHEEARDTGPQPAEPLSFEGFFHAHEQQIFSYLWRMTGDEQAAYDLSQETFLRAWRHFAHIQSYELPAGWLFRVATNLALKHLRHRRVVTGLVVTSLRADAATSPHAEPAMPDPAARLAEDDLVRDVLLDLLPRPRAVLVLHDVYGFTTAEIAGMLAMTRAAVKMMLSRAREQFRARYLRQESQEQEAHP